MASPFAKFFGVAAEPAGGGSLSIGAGKATMRFVTPGQLPGLFPKVVFKPKPPFVAALELFVADPAQTRKYLTDVGVPHSEADGDAIEVAPDEACGVVLRFVRRS
jgi:hypothetical protein